MKPLCFVIMPFGKKKDIDGNTIDFDEIYQQLIHPAVIAANMEAIRADEETVNGIIHKPMYERLILCDYAIADLTTANANVFYELGIRHAVKPFTTVTIFAGGAVLPFDLNAVRCYPYSYNKENGLQAIDKDLIAIAGKLKLSKKQKNTDSPIYQLVDGISFQNSVAHQKTDVFRDTVEYNQKIKDRLEDLRNLKTSKAEKVAALDALIPSTIDPENEETGVLIDVMLCYRELSAFDKMIDFIEGLPWHIKNTIMVQEQLGFALNRVGNRRKAIRVLETVIKENGPSSETYGILGRVYKDFIVESYDNKDFEMARAYIDDALDAYKKGFEADWRDAYPGINYATCLELKGEAESIAKIIPVVEYSVLRKKESKKADYWDDATLAELAVIKNDFVAAKLHLVSAKKRDHVEWMLQSTNKNLIMIKDFRILRGEDTYELQSIIESLPLP